MINIRTFEVSSKKNKNGRRKFKMILYEIFPDDCVVDETGTLFNENGITWIRKHCESALSSITGMSLRCEFIDEDRTELCGHGETEIRDGLPIFENAVVVGIFEKGYIDEIVVDGVTKTVCIGEGTIDEMCYKNFVDRLELDLINETAPNGSIEIFRTSENEEIIYEYGYKDAGRIPSEFIHSGFVLLGVRAADQSAKIIELNSKTNKEEIFKMDEKLMSELLSSIKDIITETNSKDAELKSEINELDSVVKTKESEISALNSETETIKTALESAKKEVGETYEKIDDLYSEIASLKDELAKAQSAERINELNSALSEFSEDEVKYAEKEIECYNSAPLTSEINSVVAKVWEGIGKKAKEAESKITSEVNAKKNDIEDIFSDVGVSSASISIDDLF